MENNQQETSAEVIRFGTDGWRGVIGRDFTFENVARVAKATATFLLSPERKQLDIYQALGTDYRPAVNGVIVGYDMRFLSKEFAFHFARVLRDSGLPVTISDAPVPTPAVSYAVSHDQFAAGIMFTASHNPPIYNGIKYKAEYGGSAPEEVTSTLEAYLPPNGTHPRCSSSAIARSDLKRPLLQKIRSLIDPQRLTASPIKVVVDSMYGSAQGYVAQLLDEYEIPYVDVRGRRDPLFGGKKPEPIEPNLVPLRAVIRGMKSTSPPLVGVATDGDGDRISAMDEKGRFIDAHRTFALILRYLVEERGMQGTVVKSFALTDMAQDMCREFGLKLIEVPIGFKYAVEQILKRDVLIAAEESGSIAMKGHIPERDGVLFSMILAEMTANSGKPLSQLLDNLHEDFGPRVYRRIDIKTEARQIVVDKLELDPPEKFAGFTVDSVDMLDGVKLRFKSGWLLLRASGTEPILRMYCEMPTRQDVNEILEEAQRVARGELRLW